MILTTPLFSSLKKIFPDYKLFVLTSELNNEIALRDENISGTFVYKKNLFSAIGLISKLRKTKFDYWIDTKPEHSTTSKMLLKFGKYDKSAGFNAKEKLFDLVLDDFVQGEHAVDINLSAALYFKKDFNSAGIKPSINIPQETIEKYSALFGRIKKKKILINISAGFENRQWGKNNWLELINKIDRNFDVIIIADKKDKEILNEIINEYKEDNLIPAETGNIFDVAEIVRNCDVIITPDTSIVHIASCFNKPIVALYNNVYWNLRRYAPLSDCQRIILSNDKNNISDIKVENVFEKLKEIIV